MQSHSETHLLDDEVALRSTNDRDRADDWMLVLAATGLPGRVVRDAAPDDGGPARFVVAVPAGAMAAARQALDAYDRETAAGPAVAPPAPVRGSFALGIVVAILLLGFQLVTGLAETRPDSRWIAAGVANAAAIRAGDWWRAVTAMTLHADLVHLLGNAAASLLFVSAVGRWLGPGLAAALIVVAGTAANLLTALARPHQVSLGASTATFAALGLLAGLQAVRRWRGGGPLRRRAWLSFGAGLALFAMLGVGQKADVYAHLFGLGAGCLLGIAAGAAVDRPPPRRWTGGPVAQALLAAAALAAIVAAWALALTR